MVAWQRWQKRATSRTAALHLGQGIVTWEAAVPSSELGILDEIFDAGRVSRAATWSFATEVAPGEIPLSGEGAAVAGLAGSPVAISRGGLPPGIPEDELLVIAHSNGPCAERLVHGACMHSRR